VAKKFAMEEDRNVQKKLKYLEKTRFFFQEYHPETSWALYEVGKAYEEYGDYENELRYKKDSLRIDRKILIDKQEIKNLAKSLNNVGLAYGHVGDFYNELNYCLEALKNFKKISKSKYDSEIASLIGNVALAFGHLGDFENQLTFSLEALEIRKSIFKNDKNLDIALSLNSVGYAYACFNNENQQLALQYSLDSYKIHTSLSSKPNIYLLRSVINVGICYFLLKKYELSGKYFSKALRISNELYPMRKDHPFKSLILNNIGAVNFYQNEFGNSLEHFKESLHMRENSYSKTHPFMAVSYHNLSIVNGIIGNETENNYYSIKSNEIDSKCMDVFKRANIFAHNLKINMVRILKS
jgi:tetratricopeptide (TPR) repeat protein